MATSDSELLEAYDSCTPDERMSVNSLLWALHRVDAANRRIYQHIMSVLWGTEPPDDKDR